MQYWLSACGYTLVEPKDVSIPNYQVPLTPPLYLGNPMLRMDNNIPCVLEMLFNDTLAVRVIQQKTIIPSIVDSKTDNNVQVVVEKTHVQQMFLIVRQITELRFSLKEIVEICAKFISLADCVLFATGLVPQSRQMLLRKASEYKHQVSIIPLKDISFDKMQHRGIPNYIIQNEQQIKQIEKKRQSKRKDWSRLPVTDAAARYLRLKVGMVVKIECPLNYKIVTAS